MNENSSMGTSISTAGPTFSVVVANDSVFITGESWLNLSTTAADSLTAPSRVVSSTGRADITMVSATNYTGGVREIYAEPVNVEAADGEEDRPLLLSELPHALNLLVVARRNGCWTAMSRNVKKIVAGDLIVATPPVTPMIREISVKVMFPDQKLSSVVVARVTSVRDSNFTGRKMKCLSFSGGPGIVCDGLMIFPG